MPLVIPHAFAGAGLNTPTTQLDANYNAIRDWINARNPTVGPIANRPAAGNAGAIWIASDSIPPNQITLDTGAVWVTVLIDPTILPGANFLQYTEISTPAAPAANNLRTFVLTSAALPRLAGLDPEGAVLTYTGILARATPAALVNSAAETTLLSHSVQANTLNGAGLGLLVDLAAILLNNSGGVNGITYKVKLGGVVLLTLATGNIAASATYHGVDLQAAINFYTGGATPTYGAKGALRLGNVGIGGTSVGVQVTDFSYGSSAALGAISTIVDNTLEVTAQLSAANANLRQDDCVVRAKLE